MNENNDDIGKELVAYLYVVTATTPFQSIFVFTNNFCWSFYKIKFKWIKIDRSEIDKN